MMKIKAIYLPQFHEVKENNEWWGKGYTEWTAVKNARNIEEWQTLPERPLDDIYYDLTDKETLVRQAALARKYSVDSFAIYHYWFKGKKMLYKPAEILLENTDIDIGFSFIWANESWTRAWYGRQREVLLKQEYGDKDDWRRHWEYLIQFFVDPRYEKIDNKPVLQIYRSAEIEVLEEMLQCFEEWSLENGFDGIHVVSALTGFKNDFRYSIIDEYYLFNPKYSLVNLLTLNEKVSYRTSVVFRKLWNTFRKTKKLEHVLDFQVASRLPSQNMIGTKRICPGVFPRWDNTPRRGFKGYSYKNCSPSAFRSKLEEIGEFVADDDFTLYINAWNEWGEGCMLEPSSNFGEGFLRELKEWKANY